MKPLKVKNKNCRSKKRKLIKGLVDKVKKPPRMLSKKTNKKKDKGMKSSN